MKLLLMFCLFLVGCTVDATFEQKPQKPKVKQTPFELLRLQGTHSIAVTEYKRGKTTYLIFKCGDQLFVQKVEDTLSGK